MSHAQQLIDECLRFIDSCRLGDFSWPMLVKSVRLTVEHVSDIQDLTPNAKKQLVIDVAKAIIDRDHGPLDQFDDIFKPLISATIDEIIEVGAKGLRIRKQECSAGGCFSLCSGIGTRCLDHV